MPVSLRRETLAEQMADGLIAYIDGQALAPGTLLPSETHLAQEFGVSRQVVREALRVLSAKDIVSVVRGRGTIVRPLSSDLLHDYFRRALQVRQATVVELLEVRQGIEVQSAALAALRRTDAQVANLSRLLASMGEHVRDANRFRPLDTKFHLLVATAAHNTLLFHLVESMREPIEDTMRAVSRRRVTDEQHAFALYAHARIVDAIAARDAKAAAAAMGEHFDVAIGLVTQSAAEEPPDE